MQTNLVPSQYFVTIVTKSKIFIVVVLIVVVVILAGKKFNSSIVLYYNIRILKYPTVLFLRVVPS